MSKALRDSLFFCAFLRFLFSLYLCRGLFGDISQSGLFGILIFAEADDTDNRGNDRQCLVCDAADGENEEVVYKYQSAGEEDTLAKQLRLAV